MAVRLPLNSDLRDLFRGGIVYVGVNILYKALPLAVLPLVARKLAVEEVGVLGLFTAFVTLLIPVVACGTHGYISVQFVKRSKAELVSLAAALVAICTLAGLAILGFASLFVDLLFESTGLRARHIGLLWLAAMAHSYLEIFLIIIQMQRRPFVYAAFRLVMMVMELSGILFLVFVLDRGLDGALIAVTASPVFAVIVLVVSRAGSLRPGALNRSDVQAALKFGLPVIGYQIGFLIVVTADRVMVADILGLREAGVFLVGVQLGMAIALLSGAINKAWIPWLFPKLVVLPEAQRASIVRVEYAYFVFLLVAAAVWSVIGSFLLRLLFPAEYSAAEPVIWLVAFGHSMAGMYKTKSAYLFFVEKTRPLLILASSIAVVNIALNVTLIPELGIAGAAWATLLSYLLAFVAAWRLGHLAYPMPVRVPLRGQFG